jgi:ribosomal protein L37AE/L43A
MERVLDNSPRCQDCETRTGQRRVLLGFKFSVWDYERCVGTSIYQCSLCKEIVAIET